jgi:hypothetical protein
VKQSASVEINDEDKRLSPKAEQILSQAEAGEVQALIPILVLANDVFKSLNL